MVTQYITKHTTSPSIRELESIQYNAALSIKSALTGTSREELYQDIDLESIQ